MPISNQRAQELVIEFCRDYPAASKIQYMIRDKQEDLFYESANIENATIERAGRIYGAYFPARRLAAFAASNFRNEAHFRRTLRHELIGHFGINTFSEGEKRGLLAAIEASKSEPSIKPIWDKVDRNYPQLTDSQKAEEVYAFVCETVAPGHAINTAQNEQVFIDTCIENRENLTRSKLVSIAELVASGMADGTRQAQIIPLSDHAQFQKDIEVRKNRIPFHEEVANKIIKGLEEGTAPWMKPWKPGEWQEPHNPISGNRYRGINNMVLSMSGHSDPRWLTYNQAKDKGWQVRKGEKSTTIQYWKFRETKNKTDDNGKPVLGDDGKPVKVTYELERPKVFYAKVFNAEQIDGIPPLEVKPVTWDAHEEAEKILSNSGATILHDQSDRAYYSSAVDEIHLPDRSSFDTSDSYYATALHELGHWTGHASRLDRDLANPFGSEAYAKEELRAEISSFMFNNELGLGHDPGQHIAYVGSWVKVLKEDPNEIFRAASDAEKIRDYVMELQQQQVQTVEQDQSLAVASAYLGRIHNHQVSQDDMQAITAFMEQGSAPVVAAMEFAESKSLPLSDEGFIYKSTENMAIYSPPNPSDSFRAFDTGVVSKGETPFNRFQLSKDGAERFYTDIDHKNNQAQLAGMKGLRHGGDTEELRNASVLEYKEFLRSLDNTYLMSSGIDKLIEAHDRGDSLSYAVDSDILSELRQYHAGSVEGYSPLETVDNLVKSAASSNMKAKITRNESADEFAAPYLVSYQFVGGSESGITGEIYQDGKTAVEIEGQRLSGTGLTSDLIWQREALETAISTVLSKQQVNDSMTPRNVDSETQKAVELMEQSRAARENGSEEAADDLEAKASLIASVSLPALGAQTNPFDASAEPMLHRQFDKGREGLKIMEEGLGKTYINVPYAEKNEAKALGAKWDRGAKSWYFDATADAGAFDKWADKGVEVDLSAATGGNNFTMPEDWNGEIQLRGNIEVEIDGEKHVENAEAQGVKPEFWSLYAQTSDGLHTFLEDYDTQEQAEAVKASLQSAQQPSPAAPALDDSKVYLAVPYAEKNEAKSLGAKWDKAAKSWYAPSSVDSSLFAKWMPDASADRPAQLPQEEFRDKLIEKGFIFKGGELPAMDGKMQRHRVEGDDPGQLSGAYVGYLDGKPAGFFENHRASVKENWKSTGTQLSLEQKQALAAEAEQKRLVREAQREVVYSHHAKRCQQLWDQLKPVENNGYLSKKGVEADDVKQDKRGRLVIPLRNEDGEITSLQRISENGFKSMKKGAKKSGSFHTLNARSANGDSVILVAEGYSTAATLAKATGITTVAAIDAGNLPGVAQALKAKHPDKEIVICGDDDRFNEKGNKGREKAEEAAELVGSVALFPRFVNGDKNQKLTDWNDLYQESGLDSVKAQLAGPLGRLQAKATLERREAREQAKSQQPVKQGMGR